MRILQVDLDNVKSYRHAEIPFTPGTNAICGQNGAGKSTLLEAIGFALFDFLAVAQADFVREGEKTSSVAVHVEDRDGRVYQVVRKCGSSSQYYVYDADLDQKLTDGKQETMVWLNEFLGVADGGDLTAGDLPVLFRDAVGVPQGLLTSAFLETPSRRRDIFNPLLRVDEYERVWEQLREPGRRLEHQLQAEAERIAGLEAEVKALPDLTARAVTLQEEIETGEGQMTELDASLEEAEADLAILEARKEALDALDRTLSQAEATLHATEARMDSAQDAVTEAEVAQAIVEATTADHEAYLEAQEKLAALEARRRERDHLAAQQQGHQQALASAEARHATLAERLAAIHEAKARVKELAPRVARQNELEAALNTAQRDAERLATERQTRDREQARLEELNNQRAQVQIGIEARAEAEAKLASLREALAEQTETREARAERVVALETEAAQAEARIQEATARRKVAEAQHAQAQMRLQALKDQLAEIQAGLAERDEVEANITQTREALAEIEVQQRDLAARKATYAAEVERLERQVTMLEAADEPVCPVCEKELTPEHRGDLLAASRAQIETAAQAIAEAQAHLDEAAVNRDHREAALAALEQRVKQLPRQEEATALQAQISTQEKTVAERAAALDAEIEQEQRQAARTGDLADTLAELKPRLAALTAERDATAEAERDVEAEIQTLPRPDEIETLDAQIAKQTDTLEEIEAEIETLSSAPADVQSLTQELEALGDPRRAYQRAEDMVQTEDEVEAQATETRSEIGGLNDKIAEVVEALTAYADLDEEMDDARATLDGAETAHQRYLQHVREAEALPERRQAVANLATVLAEAQAAYEERRAERETTAAGYDAELHATVRDELSVIRADHARLEERLDQQQAQLVVIQEEIARLETVRDELTAAQAKRQELVELQEFLAYLRQVLRSAGPEVTRAMVEMISLHADRLYADIMQSYRSRLRWTEEYEVILTTEGRERTFQQLSGGEQMAAALAVRLALLRETSTIDVAFFDEPTANLDGERRANLARQILNVKGFSQLFVISHDDTFEQDTDHVVRVWKEDGVSHVET
jgi:exonuclease SbcC